MSDIQSTSAPPPASGSAVSEATKTTKAEPLSQQKENRRPKWWPDWAQQLPYFKLPPANPNFQLVDRVELFKLLEGKVKQPVIELIVKDLDHLEKELMPLFSERDREASRQQNRYRLFQLGFIALATLATILGSLLALSVGAPDVRRWVPFLSFAETVVALYATYLATISGREPPLPIWLMNRRRAESLRREYFRFLMDLPPYDEKDSYQRRMLLAERAAIINQGNDPDQKSQSSTPGSTTPSPAPTSPTASAPDTPNGG